MTKSNNELEVIEEESQSTPVNVSREEEESFED
jgi:hypothetical protein